MPEIAEVARLVHFLRHHLVGKRITSLTAPDDAIIFGKVGTTAAAFRSALVNKKVVAAGSQGKYFWLELESPPHAVMHLGMTGWIHVKGEQTAYTRYADRMDPKSEGVWPPKFWRFDLEAEGDENGKGKTQVAFTDPRRFGRIRLVDCPGSEIRDTTPLAENGPDPVIDRPDKTNSNSSDIPHSTKQFTLVYLTQKMTTRHVPIKALLLDQSTISGIGNWVADEILYQASIHPEQYSDSFSPSEIEKLFNAVCYVCDTAVEVLGDSEKFPKDWLFNHRWGKGKKGEAAKMTLPSGERITFLTVGGRTSCIVPQRQRKTGGVAGDLLIKYSDAEEDGEEAEEKVDGVKAKKGAKRAKPAKKTTATKMSKKAADDDSDGAVKQEEEEEIDEAEDEPIEPPTKKARTAAAGKKAAVKKEGNPVTKESTITTKTAEAIEAKAKVKAAAPPSPVVPAKPAPDSTGRRRSTRLSSSKFF
ncbi:formamidopyrimidine-DNA glycosylase [Xylariaceae sp. FL0255]|nr:formamidopyrimidine-DNA glycosylase [Xylariaceae sp. FL0255]